MENILEHKEKHYTNYSTTIENNFNKIRYGISSCKESNETYLMEIRKELVDLYSNMDRDALNQVNILYNTNYNVTYESEHPNSDFSVTNGSGSITYKDNSSMNKPSQVFKVNYLSRTGIVDNVIDINTNGNVTRINLNPTAPLEPGTAETYLHLQKEPAKTWTINHMLGLVPNVYIEDEQNVVIRGVVEVIDSNTILIQFSSPVMGRAYLS